MTRPRLRSVLRTCTLALGALVALALAASLALRLYGRQRLATARAAFERQGFSLALDSYELSPVPKAENAAAWLEAGASAIVWSADDEKFAFGSADLPAAVWDEERAGRLRALVDSNRGALETFHRGASLAKASFDIPYREGGTARLPDLVALRRASTLTLLEGRVAFRDRDRERVVRSMAGLSRLAEALTAESTLVAQLMANAVDTHIVGLGAEIAVAPAPWPAESLGFEALLRAMSMGDRLGRLRTAFGYEAAAFSDWLGRGGELLGDPSPDAAWRHVRLLCRVTGWTALAQAGVTEAALHQASLLDAPILALLNEEPARSRRLLLLHRGIAEPMTRAAGRAVLTTRSTLAQRQLVRAALALRVMEAASGAYPPGRPPEAGLDDANAWNGLPLRYTVEADGSARVEIPDVTADQVKMMRRDPVLRLSLPSTKGPRPTR